MPKETPQETQLKSLTRDLQSFCDDPGAHIMYTTQETRENFLATLQKAASLVGFPLPRTRYKEEPPKKLIGGIYTRSGYMFWNTSTNSFSLEYENPPEYTAREFTEHIEAILHKKSPLRTFDHEEYKIGTPPTNEDLDMIQEFGLEFSDGLVLMEHNAPGLDEDIDIGSIINKYT